MKALLIATFIAGGVAIAPNTHCSIPEKYAARNGDLCAGPATGYNVNLFCKGGLTGGGFTTRSTTAGSDVHIAGSTRTQVFPLTTTSASKFSDPAVPAMVAGCHAPSLTVDAAAHIGPTIGCPAYTTTFPNTQEASMVKGVEVTCDAANHYYASSGTEGSAMCQSGAAAPWDQALATVAWWQTNFGSIAPKDMATWAAFQNAEVSAGDLTCSQACVIPEPLCVDGNNNDNVEFYGPSLVAGACRIKPSHPRQQSSVRFACKSSPAVEYTARCTANNDPTLPGTLSWDNDLSPMCGGADSISTGFYSLGQADGLTTQPAGDIVDFPRAASLLTNPLTRELGQWGGGFLRNADGEVHPFETSSNNVVDITNCNSSALCVQQVANWWRCNGLTVDTSTVCVANNTRIACPTHTNGYRCGSSSKKGLSGLLGLLLLCPLLLCSLLLCCCLGPCFLRKKKSEGDMHLATYESAPPAMMSYYENSGCAVVDPSMGMVGPSISAI